MNNYTINASYTIDWMDEAHFWAYTETTPAWLDAISICIAAITLTCELLFIFKLF